MYTEILKCHMKCYKFPVILNLIISYVVIPVSTHFHEKRSIFFSMGGAKSWNKEKGVILQA